MSGVLRGPGLRAVIEKCPGHGGTIAVSEKTTGHKVTYSGRQVVHIEPKIGCPECDAVLVVRGRKVKQLGYKGLSRNHPHRRDATTPSGVEVRDAVTYQLPSPEPPSEPTPTPPPSSPGTTTGSDDGEDLQPFEESYKTAQKVAKVLRENGYISVDLTDTHEAIINAIRGAPQYVVDEALEDVEG